MPAPTSFYWEIENGIVSREVSEWARERYEQYRAGKVSEEQMCGDMVTMDTAASRTACYSRKRKRCSPRSSVRGSSPKCRN